MFCHGNLGRGQWRVPSLYLDLARTVCFFSDQQHRFLESKNVTENPTYNGKPQDKGGHFRRPQY